MSKTISVTKEMIDATAFDMAKKNGVHTLTARDIAATLGCSTQPIYKTYANMDALKKNLQERLIDFILQSIVSYQKTGCAFLDSGLGYIHFAKTEKMLFRTFCIENQEHSLSRPDIQNQAIRALMDSELENLPLSTGSKDKIFIQTMIFTYGLAVMAYLEQLELTESETAQLLQDAFDSYVSQEMKRS